MRIAILFLLAALTLGACAKDKNKDLSPEEQLEADILMIQEYLADNNLTAQSTASGLHYIIQTPGTGANPTLASQVTVHYKGYFLDGKVFDQTTSNPATFPLSNVIRGWQEGIPLFKKGGKGVLLIPSALGYGRNPPPSIPRNAVLVFDVELLNF